MLKIKFKFHVLYLLMSLFAFGNIFAFHQSENSKQPNPKFYYDQINEGFKNYMITSDSQHLDNLFQEILTWDNTIVNNCFFSLLEKAQKFYVHQKNYSQLYLTFVKQAQCGLRKGMINYFKTDEQYQDFFSSVYGQKLLDRFDSLEAEYLKSLNILYFSRVHILLEKDQFPRNLLYGSEENMWMGEKLEVFKNLPDSLNMEIVYSLMRHIDSLCFEEIIQLVNTYGFPSNAKVGQGGLGYILAHIYGCPGMVSGSGIRSQEFFDSILPIAVENLEISNTNYAFEKDYATSTHSNRCSEPYSTYGSSMNIGQGKRAILEKIIDIKNVDKRRAEIYLPPLWIAAILENFDLPEDYPVPEEARKFF